MSLVWGKVQNSIHATLRWGRAPGKPSLAGACWATAAEYLLGEKRTIPYRIVFVLLVFGGAVMGDNLAWDLADTFNGMMMIPNLIGVIALSGVVMKITRNYIRRMSNSLRPHGL